jgi:hypothetical protein
VLDYSVDVDNEALAVPSKLHQSQETLSKLIDLQGLARTSNTKTLLSEVKKTSPMVFSFMESFMGKYTEYFMVSGKAGDDNLRVDQQAPLFNTTEVITPSRFIRKTSSSNSMLGIMNSKAQVLVKLITEYLNKTESYQRLLVTCTH